LVRGNAGSTTQGVGESVGRRVLGKTQKAQRPRSVPKRHSDPRGTGQKEERENVIKRASGQIKRARKGREKAQGTGCRLRKKTIKTGEKGSGKRPLTASEKKTQLIGSRDQLPRRDH